MEERFTIRGSAHDLVRWLDLARQLVSRPYFGKKYKGGWFGSLQISNTPYQPQADDDVVVELYLQYRVLEGGGFHARLERGAIVFEAKRLPGDRLSVTARTDHASTTVRTMFREVVALAGATWPEAGLTSLGKPKGKGGRRRHPAHDYAYEQVVVKGRAAKDVYPEWREKRGTADAASDVDTFEDMLDAIDYRRKHPR